MSFNIPPNVLCVPVMEYLVNKVNGEVMEANGDIEIIYKNGIVRSVKGKSKKLTKKENKRIQKHIDAIVKSYAEDDW